MADGKLRMAGLTLTVAGADKFQKELDEANKAARKNSAEMRKLDAAYGKGSKETDYLVQKQALLTRQLETQRQKTQAYREAREKYAQTTDASAEKLDKLEITVINSEAAEAKLERQIRETGDAIAAQAQTAEEAKAQEEEATRKAAEAQAQEAAQAAEAARQLEEESRAAQSVSERFRTMARTMMEQGGAMQEVGKRLYQGLTLPIMRMGKQTLQTALDFEDAMYTVATMPGVLSDFSDPEAARKEIAAYGKEVLAASNETGIAAKELAAAQQQAISSGVAVAESVDYVAKSAKAAKAGLTDAETVVDGATSILNAWKDSAGGLDHVLDVMQTAQNEGKTTVGELAAQIGDLTGLAPQLGLSLEDTMAAVAALTKNGVATNKAVTGLKAVLSNVIKPSTEAAKEAKRLGLAFDASALQAKGLSGFLADVMEKSKGDTEVLAKLFGSVEGLNQVMLLGGAAAEDYGSILLKMSDCAGTMEQAFSVRTSSKLERFNNSLNRLSNAGMNLAENLSPVVDTVTDLLGDAAELLGGLDDGTQRIMTGAAAVMTALGPVTKGVGGLLTMGGKLAALIASPWGPVVAGIAGFGLLTTAITLATAQAEKLDEQLRNLDLQVDDGTVQSITSAINAGIAAADSEYKISLAVDANMAPLREQVADIFADGNMTRRERSSLAKAVRKEIDGEVKEIQAALKEKKAAIRATLDSLTNEDGEALYTEEEKDALAEAAVQPMRDAMTELTGLKGDLDTLLAEIAKQGGTATEAQIEALNGILDQMQGLEQRVREMQDENIEKARKAYITQKEGYGDAETFGTAIGYGAEKYANAKADIAQRKEEAGEARDAAIAAAEEAGASQAAFDAARRTYADAIAALDAEAAQAEADRDQIWEDSWAGLAKQNEEGAQALEEAARLAALGGKIRERLLSGEGFSDADLQSIFTTDNIARYFSDTPLAGMTGAEALASGLPLGVYAQRLMENLGTELQKLLTDNEGALSPFSSALQAMLDQGIDLEGLDWSQVDGSLRDTMLLHLMQTDGEAALGSDVGKMLLDGLQGAAEAAESAGENAAGAMDRGLQTGGAKAVLTAEQLVSSVATGLGAPGADMSGWTEEINSIRKAILAGKPMLIAEAQRLREEIEGILQGTQLTAPGLGGGFGSLGNGNGPVNPVYSNDNSVNVYVNTAHLGSRQSVQGFAAELAALNRSTRAGLGTVE